MKLLALDEVVEQIGSSIRSHFSTLQKQRANYMEMFESKNLELKDYIINDWPEANMVGSFLLLENSEFKFPFRLKKGDVIWISQFDLTHLRNSLISNILLPEAQGSIKFRIDKIIYLFYSYWFIKKNTDIDTLTHNVCFELQEIIKQLIEKELTLYRNNSTAILIESIRWRLASENMLLLARIKPLNMRKL